jgi:hypothetical protein
MVCAHISDAHAQAPTAPESIPFTMDLAAEYQIAARACAVCAAGWGIKVGAVVDFETPRIDVFPSCGVCFRELSPTPERG